MESDSSLKYTIKLKNPRPKLKEAEIEEIRAMFNLFSMEGTGLLNTNELKETMKSLGFEKNNPKIYQMISELDEKQNGTAMNFEEFLEALITPAGNTESIEGVNKLFDQFVEDGSNTITTKHIEAAVKDLKEELNFKEIEEILKSSASDKKAITRDEFYNILTRKTFT